MTPFLKKIIKAAGLTRLGQVSEATAILQRALHSASATASERSEAVKARSGVVLDGLVREVAPAPVPPLRPAPGAGPEAPDVPPAVARHDRGASEDDHTRGAFRSGRFIGAGGGRDYKLYTPGDRGGRRLPLVVMLHGCKQDPDDFAAGTRMNELAQAEGFFVLYPAQGPRSNAHKCWNWFNAGDQRRGAGEPALIAGMARQVMQEHAIDPARVYVAGLSAGGAMAAILAREYPDLFAAAGIHSGLPPGAAHDVASAFAAMKTGRPAGVGPARPGATPPGGGPASPPVIVFHGDADATVAPANGEAVVAAALGGGAGQARRVRTEHAAARTYSRTVWPDERAPEAPSRAELWQIRAAPHAWSGGSAAGSFTDPAGPDASAEMLRFFLEHPLQAAAHAAHA